MAFALLRDGVNLHPFAGLSDDAQESLQIHIEFSTPASRAFPVLLLLRWARGRGVGGGRRPGARSEVWSLRKR